jgi:hypothetical protein
VYVLHVHLTKTKRSLFIRDKSIFSSERMLYKDSGRKGSVKKNSGRESQGVLSQNELIGDKPPVIK